jgi:hypothetical protein
MERNRFFDAPCQYRGFIFGSGARSIGWESTRRWENTTGNRAVVYQGPGRVEIRNVDCPAYEVRVTRPPAR